LIEEELGQRQYIINFMARDQKLPDWAFLRHASVNSSQGKKYPEFTLEALHKIQVSLS
jgi:hypothetical protein